MDEPFQYRVPKARRTRLEQAVARTEQAETRTEQAKSRTEAAETRAELAETRTESAKTRTEQAETRAENAETRVEQAESMVETLVGTMAGGKSVPTSAAVSLADEADLRALGCLTSRQREVLKLIAIGENTKQIADTLNISPKTVEYHRTKLMESVGIHDVPSLVRFALRVGLIGLVPTIP